MNYLAIDLGAESGRVIKGTLNNQRLELEVLHRFANRPVLLPDGLHWDTLYLFSEIKHGLTLFHRKYGRDLAGISCDSWGVDYGLLDKNDCLVSNPYHYRDHRTDGVMEKVFEITPPFEIYRETGIQFMPINTIFQLYCQALSNPELLSASRKMLMTADLFNFFLSGAKTQEFSLATTSQLYNPVSGTWSETLFRKLGLPLEIMPLVCPPATVIGKLTGKLAAETGLPEIPVIAGASHDTADAVAACPAQKNERFAYLSSGTWSLLGVEIPKPLLSKDAMEDGFTNEGGVRDTIRFLHNITGLWILQECRRKWLKSGADGLDYAALVSLAEKTAPFKALINPDDPAFLAPADMEEAIVNFCRKTKQPVPVTRAEFVRTILESLALRYSRFVRIINRLFPDRKPIAVLYIVGGGSQNRLLNQFTANAAGVPVIAGPTEATAAGNILTQALAVKEISALSEAREIVRNSFALETYLPSDQDAWLAAGERLEGLS